MADDFHGASTIKVVAPHMSDQDTIAFQAALAGELGQQEAEIVASEPESGPLLAEIQDVAYTLILAGGTLEYLAGVIPRLRSRFADCAVFDFRDNTLAISKHPEAEQMRGKTIIVAENGKITVESVSDRGIFRNALRKLFGDNDNGADA
ncbi:MAG TPA: hypothetical protein VME67_05540 [Mycobacterium sp.]|nr:hypothetical protein [Mycobacterium sp.]HTX94334.1 hypothetical protein [Mycobacterium sp.]